MSIYLGTGIKARELTNLITNSLAPSSWTKSSNVSLTRDSTTNEFTVTATANIISNTSAYVYQLFLNNQTFGPGTSSNYQILYFQVKIKGTFTNSGPYPLLGEWYANSSASSTNKTYFGNFHSLDGTPNNQLGDGTWHTLSSLITTYDTSGSYIEKGIALGLTGISGAAIQKNDTVTFKDLIAVNLTTAFTFGNEPSLEECDKKIFLNNSSVYYEDSTGIAINRNKIIEEMYIGTNNSIPKKILKGYVGTTNNIPKKFFSYLKYKKILQDMTNITNLSLCSGTSNNISISLSSYSSGLYYLLVFYSPYLSIYKFKNGSLTDMNSVSQTYAKIYKSLFTSTWSLSNNGGSSAAKVWTGMIALVQFPNFTEEKVDEMLNNITLFGYTGRSDSMNNISSNFIVSGLYQNTGGDYIITFHGTPATNSDTVYTDHAYFTIWDMNYNKIYPALNSGLYGATVNGTYLNLGTVNGSVIVIKEN